MEGRIISARGSRQALWLSGRMVTPAPTVSLPFGRGGACLYVVNHHSLERTEVDGRQQYTYVAQRLRGRSGSSTTARSNAGTGHGPSVLSTLRGRRGKSLVKWVEFQFSSRLSMFPKVWVRAERVYGCRYNAFQFNSQCIHSISLSTNNFLKSLTLDYNEPSARPTNRSLHREDSM